MPLNLTPEERKAHVRIINKKWKQKNKEKVKQYNKRWNEQNKEKVKQYHQTWRKKHPKISEQPGYVNPRKKSLEHNKQIKRLQRNRKSRRHSMNLTDYHIRKVIKAANRNNKTLIITPQMIEEKRMSIILFRIKKSEKDNPDIHLNLNHALSQLEAETTINQLRG